MRIAFYAPLKPPHHPTPSGDRAMARAVIAALEAGGITPDLASDFRSREPLGDEKIQVARMVEADALVPRLVSKGKQAGWGAWMTYHNYYKAPDLLGPEVADILGIPYLQIESTRARKRLKGPWATYAKAAEAASDAADVIFFFTRRDAEALKAYAVDGQALVHLPPFLPRSELPKPSDYSGAMLSVGMFRQRDKLESYQVIADTLAMVRGDWQLDIVGDGQARADVNKLMVPFGSKVRFLGKLDAQKLASVYAQSRLLFWPGVNEAFGMIYLEAQAHGLAVVAQNRPGVCDVLAPGTYPAPKAGPDALATQLNVILKSPADFGHSAREYIAAHHLMPSATRRLLQGLQKATAK